MRPSWHPHCVGALGEETDGLDYITRDAVKWIGEAESVANPLTGETTTEKATASGAAAATQSTASAK